jgi:hypothetical protein
MMDLQQVHLSVSFTTTMYKHRAKHNSIRNKKSNTLRTV